MQQITNKQMTKKTKWQMTNDQWQITNNKPDGWIKLDDPDDQNEPDWWAEPEGWIHSDGSAEPDAPNESDGWAELDGWMEGIGVLRDKARATKQKTQKYAK